MHPCPLVYIVDVRTHIHYERMGDGRTKCSDFRTFGDHVSVILQGVSPPRRACVSLTRMAGMICCLFAPLPPRQPDDERVEDGQGAKPESGLPNDPVQLVSDEDQKERDHPGVKPADFETWCP